MIARVRASPASSSVGSVPSNRTRTWLSTTSLRIATPSAPPERRSAIRRASAQSRSMRSTSPDRPSDRSAGQDREPAGPARRLGRPVVVVPLRRRRSRCSRTAPSVIAAWWAAASRTNDEPGVVRDVEPLVRVGRPRIGALRSRASDRAATGRPPPRCRTPHRRGPRRPARGRSAISASNGSNAPVFTLPAWAHTMVGPSIAASVVAERLGAHPALVVRGDHPDVLPLAAEAEHLERRVDRDVRALVGDDRDVRRALQSVPLDVPADLGEHAMARGRERREVGHRRAGDEPDARPGRQPEQLDEPGAGDLLGDRGGRRERVQAGVLVPRARQPVGGQGGRQAAHRRRTRSSAGRHSPRALGPRQPPGPRRPTPDRTARPAAARPSPRGARRGRPPGRPGASASESR